MKEILGFIAIIVLIWMVAEFWRWIKPKQMIKIKPKLRHWQR